MADDQIHEGDLDCVGEENEREHDDEKKTETEEKSSEKKRIFDSDRFDFVGSCETCSAGIFDDKDHTEFLIERSCAPTRSYFYRNAIMKHWPDFQGLLINMQPFCYVCKKHFWGLPDFTRHAYNMAFHGVEDVRQLDDYVDVEIKKEESSKSATPSKAPEKKTDESGAKETGTSKNQKNRNRVKRRRQAHSEAVQAELQRRLKRAEEIAASLPEEEIPNDEQREVNKTGHRSLYESITQLIKMGSTTVPTREVIELLNEMICTQSPRWFEASYMLGNYGNTSQQQFVSSATLSQDLASGKSNVALFEARWRWARGDMDESSFLEMKGKLNEQSQLSTADRERSLRRIAENGDLWKEDECSPPGETFNCLVCDKKGRSLRIHLDEALWLTNVSSVVEKNIDLPDCPISVEASLGEMRKNTVMAHVYHYLGEESTRRLIEELSFKANRVLRCPACMFHYRALRCCLTDLFSHIQTCGFMKVDGDFKDSHQAAALRISSIIAEARGGFKATSAIINELVEYLVCDEGGLHVQRRGAVTAESLRANPRVMARIRQAVTRKMDEATKQGPPAKTVKKVGGGVGPAKAQQVKKTVKTVKPAGQGRGQPVGRDSLHGVAQSKQMKSKKPMTVGRGRGFRSNGVGGGHVGGGMGLGGAGGRTSNLMGTHVPANIRSAPSGRSSGGLLGGRSQRDMGPVQVGVYCELCSKEFYGYSFNEANRFLHTHLMDAIFRSRREPGKTNLAVQHLKCFSNNLVYNTVSFCPSCQMTRSSLDGILHHITQLASSNDITAVQHMTIANDLVSQFIECMNGTMSLGDLSIFVQRRFIR